METKLAGPECTHRLSVSFKRGWKVKMKVLVARLCLILCDLMDGSPSGSSVHGILQARTPEWVAIFFSRGSSPLRDHTWVSYIAGKFFTNWDTREAQTQLWVCRKLKFSLLGLSGIFFFFFPKYLDPHCSTLFQMLKTCWHIRLTAGSLKFAEDVLPGGLLVNSYLFNLLWGQLTQGYSGNTAFALSFLV